MVTRHTHTVLVEIIRDSKNKYFRKLLWSKFQDSELLGSRIIRHVRICICACKSVCTAPHTHSDTHTHMYIGVKEMAAAAICIESDNDVVEPEVENEKTQSSIESFFAPLPAGQVLSPRPRSEVRLGRPRSGKTSKRPIGSPLCIHESREQRSLTQTRCPTT